MGRFPQFVGKKGSKKWIQRLINEKPELLNSEIRTKLNLPSNEEIYWFSPLKKDEYAEYSDQDFIDLLVVKLEKAPLSDFWPERGPQWDAIGKSGAGKLFLVEAKSHIQELISTMEATDEGSIRKIRRSLDRTKNSLSAKAETDWARGFYQYTNRLAHLYLLRKNQLPAYLVFVYFMKDPDMNGPKTIEEWRGAIKLLHFYLGIGRHKLKKFVADVFIDVGCLR
jgi:hypothetical protein